MNDTMTCALRELLKRKKRTITNIFGYVLAVVLTILLVCSLLNSREKTDQILNNTGTHFMAFLPACIPSCIPYSRYNSLKEDEGFVANGLPTNLISLSFIDEVQELPTVKDASPFLLFQFKDLEDNHLFTIGGFNPNDTIAVGTTTCSPSDVIAGRFLTPNDSGRVMVEEGYAQSKKIKIEDLIAIRGGQFTVIGIVNPGIRPAKANVYMVYGDAEKTINREIKVAPIHDQANILLVESRSAKTQDSAMKSIKTLFPSLVFSSYNCYRPAAQVMGLTEKTAWSLIIVIMISTTMLSMKSQLSSIIERQREIGILKSIGWDNREVVSQIIMESIIQALLGGFIGILISVLIIFLYPGGIFSKDILVSNNNAFL